MPARLLSLVHSCVEQNADVASRPALATCSQTIANRTAPPQSRAEKIKALLEEGRLDPNALDMDGKTLLHWAAFQGGSNSTFYAEEAQIAAALVVGRHSCSHLSFTRTSSPLCNLLTSILFLTPSIIVMMIVIVIDICIFIVTVIFTFSLFAVERSRHGDWVRVRNHSYVLCGWRG